MAIKRSKLKPSYKPTCESKCAGPKGLAELAKTNLLTNFVKKNKGCWDHDKWLGLVEDLKSKGYEFDPDQMGLMLEDKKAEYLRG